VSCSQPSWAGLSDCASVGPCRLSNEGPQVRPRPGRTSCAAYGTTACNGLSMHELRASIIVSTRVAGVDLACGCSKWVR
jgi:hypothetical protein